MDFISYGDMRRILVLRGNLPTAIPRCPAGRRRLFHSIALTSIFILRTGTIFRIVARVLVYMQFEINPT